MRPPRPGDPSGSGSLSFLDATLEEVGSGPNAHYLYTEHYTLEVKVGWMVSAGPWTTQHSISSAISEAHATADTVSVYGNGLS